MHSKARLKKLRMMRCQRTDVEFYKLNFYAKLGVQIWTTLVSVQYVTTTSQFTLSERNGLVYKPHPRFLAQNLSKKMQLIHESLRYLKKT